VISNFSTNFLRSGSLHSCVRALCAATHSWVSRPQCRPRTALWDSCSRSNLGSRGSTWTSAPGSLSKPPPRFLAGCAFWGCIAYSTLPATPWLSSLQHSLSCIILLDGCRHMRANLQGLWSRLSISPRGCAQARGSLARSFGGCRPSRQLFAKSQIEPSLANRLGVASRRRTCETWFSCLSKGWAPESLGSNRWKRARKGPLRG
jgi:hypothetical protein